MIREISSKQMRSLIATDARIVVSVITPIEVQSAMWRRRHHDELSADQHATAEEVFTKLSESWSEIDDIFVARQVALGLIKRHALRAADALQLAAALIAAGDDLLHLPFVTLDNDLADAARAEGFPVLP